MALRTEAEKHASDRNVVKVWQARAREALAGGHPSDRPAVFYRHFEDGSSVQVTATGRGVEIQATVPAGVEQDG